MTTLSNHHEETFTISELFGTTPDNGNIYIPDANSSNGHVYMEYNEGLNWHVERDSETLHKIFDFENNQLQPGAEKNILDTLKAETQRNFTTPEGYTLEWCVYPSTQDDDENSLEFTAMITTPEGFNTSLQDQDMLNTIYNAYAIISNLTDPGTFGTPYLFSI